ncbi:pyridoxamine 5'-phosphate oxidase [Mycobacterium tuberculosis]|nr:pyridoxamine 5'-phosphate oxidase [Mycobacterium tuberculosis]CNG36522.1 pyridoxamine 5'-phosphate oxidase [Mycobacterium tuberculosis]CNL60512.1 pyridoxamine 5'-phosphate oxidase [Mycobacterium tuberculosis]
MEGQADPQHAAGDAGDLTLRGRPTSEAVEATAAILDESQTGAVYDAIVKRYGIQGKLFTFVSKLRGGMRNNIGLELKVAESETG